MHTLLDMTLPEFQDLVKELGEPSYRASQIYGWLWAKGALSINAMTNLSLDLREKLAGCATIAWPVIADTRISRDGTVKFLLRLGDGSLVETVLIPEPDHLTQCLSTQVGCALGCSFCSTGAMGLTRNMSQGEILGQVWAARRYLAEQGDTRRLRNLVFMGMGEPLLNLDVLLNGLAILTDDKGLHFSYRRITVSTVGVIPSLNRFGRSGLASLAVSLHAPTQELRQRIMPRAAEAWPLDQLMAALDAYPLRARQRITYEYILLGGVNDSLKQAKDLVRLLGGRKAKVNLIAYNPPEGQAPCLDQDGMPYSPPATNTVAAFQQYLHDKGMTATLRKSKGQDIGAACGQLLTSKQ